MPFKSEAQRRYLYAKEPKVAKRFEKETPKGKRLPARVGKKSSLLAAYLGGKKKLGR
jgi:hypothetical protein